LRIRSRLHCRLWIPLAVVIMAAVGLFPLLAAESVSTAVVVSPTTVDVTNIRPGGAIVLLFCERGSRQGHTAVSAKGVVLSDDDRDGRVSTTRQTGIPLRSVWIAVDYESGAVAVGSRPEFSAMTNTLAGEALKKDVESGIAFLDQELPQLIMFVVRPGVGVWQLAARDGKAADRDAVATRSPVAGVRGRFDHRWPL